MDKKMLSFLSAYNITMDSESSMSFQKIVLIVAIIALILMLSVIGYMMYYSSQNQPFPPIEGTQRCPDGWTDAGATCTNTADTTSKMFSNVGSFLSDKYCDISAASGQSSNACTDIVGLYDRICKSQWVQGNVTNGKDPSNCYLLASQGTTIITHYGTASPSIAVEVGGNGGTGYKTHTHTVTLTGSGYSTYPTVNLVITDGIITGVNVATVSATAPQWVLTSNADTGEHVLNVLQINSVGYGGIIKAQVSSGGILSVSVNVSGSGYNTKIYQDVQLIYSSGSVAAVYPRVNITVTNGVVTSVSAGSTPGLYADAGTKMTANNGSIGSGSGFVVGLTGFAKNPATDIQISSPLTYTKQTLEKDVDWAKKYGITWDGYN